MVFVVTGTAEPDRNTVGRLLADALGWEFIDAENLHPPGNPDARRGSAALANTDPTFSIATLSAAIDLWIYEWRDVVVSCPTLTDTDRKQLYRNTSLIRIICLTTTPDRRSDFFDPPAQFMSTEPASNGAKLDPRETIFTVGS